MSPRTLLRRFAETTGQAPGEWVTSVRVDEARRLLETSRLAIDRVAEAAGFGSVGTLRHHFRRRVRLTPREYRERFGQA